MAELAGALRRAGVAEVDASARRRAEYSTDASLYRVPPELVAFPRDLDEVVAVVETCLELGVPLTARGAGTSIAGNAVGPGVVMDLGRHLRRVRSLDPEAATATVEPGVVLDDLQAAARPHGLRFGPDPSTHSRCTLGGMIGNNACGSRALAYGRTADNVLELDVVCGGGQRLVARPGAVGAVPGLEAVVRAGLAPIRTQFGRFGRQGSGYALEHLLPERGGDLARALVGSEGTLAVVLQATVQLVRAPAATVLVVLGYPDMATAADAVGAVLLHRPLALEGIDARIVDVVRRRGRAVPDLPGGGGWLLVELAGATPAEAEAAAARLTTAGAADALAARVLRAPAEVAAIWRIREDGAGFGGRSPAGAPAWAGWEDAAVPPERLGAYLRDFDALLADHGLGGIPYGHFGDGCLHVRIDFPFDRPGGQAVYRSFVEQAAALVARHGGSMSGEHGDGRARSELLPLMYSPDAVEAMAAVKAVLDPRDLLNPGVLVRPRPFDADLRRTMARPLTGRLGFPYPEDGGDLTSAVHRCTGIGRCVADNTGTGGVMCPSWLATRDEKDTTRGRSRVLQEAVNGTLVRGLSSPEVHEAPDLCLACKGCASDCPTGVDMATYKAEVLYQTYRRRLRPAAHYSLGWLPRWAALAARAPRLANVLLSTPGLSQTARRLAGVDPRRALPRFAPQTLRAWWRHRPDPRPGPTAHPRVVLWPDTFTNHFTPSAGRAAVRVLEDAGYRVTLPDEPLCCALTWVSTGQLDTAKRVLRRTVDRLAALIEEGSGGGAGAGVERDPGGSPEGRWTPAPGGSPEGRGAATLVGLEPSCLAVLRHDALALLGEDDPAAVVVARAAATLAEVLAATPGWAPPDLSGVVAVAQPHCHQHAVLGWAADRDLLAKAGAEVTAVGGCCGLAGNFGAERGHYDVSVAVAETALLPAVRAASPDAVLLADGFSCRTQLDHLTGRHALHLAELLAKAATPGGAGP
ncbi:MAG TPA: FAD-linked oxidase C-terminal domain-containing protein [Actinomycetes bacterium]|nr:FAD-linked oxidase C-terminal domain-containing protein [Actinomycetes bacterium]